MTAQGMHHLIVAPILLPLIAASAMLLLNERRMLAKRVIALASTGTLLAISIILLRSVAAAANCTRT